MKKRHWAILTVGACLFTSVNLSYANLIINGSFEEPSVSTNSFATFSSIPGWTLISGEPFEIWNGSFGGTHAPDGNQHLETNDSAFQQIVDTISGQKYQFSLSYSNRPGFDNHIQVEWNGAVVTDITILDKNVTGWNWSTFSYAVVASSAASTIRFNSFYEGGTGMHIDNVQLYAVTSPAPVASQTPIPAAIWMVGSALIGLVGFGRTKQPV